MAKQAWIHEAKGWVLRTLQPVDERTFRRLGWWRIVETGKFVNEQDEINQSTGPRK